MQTIEITTKPDLTFSADTAGTGPLVLLLHGFPESKASWRHAVPALAAAGFQAVAPNQRGYSPHARPDPKNLENYDYELLVCDVVEMADTLSPGTKFHVVGSDWGGQIAWGVASRFPDRVLSLTVLSRPHPSAFRRALLESEDQKRRSGHHTAFLEPETGPSLIKDDCARLRGILANWKVGKGVEDAHIAVLGNLEAIEAALAYYRANKGLKVDLGTIHVPTLYMWGDSDATVGRDAAEGTREFVAPSFKMVTFPGVGHFVMEEVAEEATKLMIEHMKANQAGDGAWSTL